MAKLPSLYYNEKLCLHYFKILVVSFLMGVLNFMMYCGLLIGFSIFVTQELVFSAGTQTAISFLPSFAMIIVGWLIRNTIFGKSGE